MEGVIEIVVIKLWIELKINRNKSFLQKWKLKRNRGSNQ